MEFQTKTAIIIRQDLLTWQKLNVTAFLATGIMSENPQMAGEPYVDAVNNQFSSLSVQPIIVLAADGGVLQKIHSRALSRNVKAAVYIEEMFSTGHDDANRAVFKEYSPDTANIVGIGLVADKKIVDKITKGAKMHP
ncbi:MAG: DUF2000 family protein [Sneathiella sp.]|nr:DUF2000 family protein [Sneathiella sp.]